MGTNEIIITINKLPVDKRLYIIEQIFKTIREKEIQSGMSEASNALYSEYKNNKEPVAFSSIDTDDFY